MVKEVSRGQIMECLWALMRNLRLACKGWEWVARTVAQLL